MMASLCVFLMTFIIGCMSPNPSIYWYTNTNLANNQRIYHQNPDLFSGFYFCCNQFQFTSNGWFVPQNDSALMENIEYFQSKVDKIYIVGSIQQLALEDFDGLVPIASFVQAGNYMQAINVNGCIIDFEPHTTNNTLAEQYNKFLSSFQATVSNEFPSLSVGMDISNWGILDQYAVYSSARLSIYTSMATTYYGYNISNNELGVEQELLHLPAESIRAGICSMISGNPNFTRNCGWNQTDLNEFLNFLKSDNINIPRVDIWRADIDYNGLNTSQWFIEKLQTFVK